MNTFHCKIYEADNPFFEGNIESIVIPAIDGEYGVLAGHQNMAIAIAEGVIKFRTSSEISYGNGIKGKREMEPNTEYVATVSTGMMLIEDGEVMILIDSAEWPDEIDEERAIRAEAEAREIMLQKRSIAEFALAEASLRRAIIRQRIIERGL
ncbi:MAG: F0F1 ATP synthase subunit epsilon [Eubacterium sp.]|nr:F0F1 ATP synthase subunit epsilon [Eubacterium sp.]